MILSAFWTQVFYIISRLIIYLFYIWLAINAVILIKNIINKNIKKPLRFLAAIILVITGSVMIKSITTGFPELKKVTNSGKEVTITNVYLKYPLQDNHTRFNCHGIFLGDTCIGCLDKIEGMMGSYKIPGQQLKCE